MKAALIALCWLGLPATLLAADAPTPSQHLGGLVVVEEAAPADVLLMVRNTKTAALLTSDVLEHSQAKPIRSFRKFLKSIEQRGSDEQVRLVNDWVNRHVSAVEDYRLYAKRDVWAPPINTLLIGGDCEDLALLKRYGLARLGHARSDMYLVVGMTRLQSPPAPHAILAVGKPGRWMLLDNLTGRVSSNIEDAHFAPAYALKEGVFLRVVDAAPHDANYWRSVFDAAHR